MKPKNKPITQKRLKEVLEYQDSTGMFIWVNPPYKHKSKTGDVAGYEKNNGYWFIQIDKYRYYAHRLVWLWFYGEFPKHELDHIDGNRKNNRISNLREATRSENSQNISISPLNTSGYPGVSFHKEKNKWRSAIQIQGVSKHLGYFDTPQEASTEYIKAKLKYHKFNPFVRS